MTVKKKWEIALEQANLQVLEEAPKLKLFEPKNLNLPILSEYSDNMGEKYWESWVKMPYAPETAKSWIDPTKLREEAERLGMTEKLKLDEITRTLIAGADLGIEGEGRWASHGPNNPSALEFGARLADSLQSAIKAGIMWGPLTLEEMPWEAFKVSPMTVRLKPNGAARIIMNLSWPHEGKLGDGIPISVNEGMADWVSFEETRMTSDYKWRECLYRAGCPCAIVKSDWNSAYK